MGEEPKFDMSSSPLVTTGEYFPLRFRIGPPTKNRARAVAAALLHFYAGRSLTFEKWRALGEITVSWSDSQKNRHESKPFRFEWLADHLRNHEELKPEDFSLPPFRAGWLDASIELKQPFHAPSADGRDEALTFALQSPLSKTFPVVPKLDREGRALSSFQLMLLQSWFDIRKRLVERSNLFFEEDHDWLRDLFMYVSTVVSAVDNTLHQIYYRAEYESAAEGWTFDPVNLGSRTGQRLIDKLTWVAKITGHSLDGLNKEVASFVEIKDLRNHLVHFDPPVIAFTIEDVANWLNATLPIATLLAGIRARIKQPLCPPLIKLLLARPVDWYPKDAGKKRIEQKSHVGYASSRKPSA